MTESAHWFYAQGGTPVTVLLKDDGNNWSKGGDTEVRQSALGSSTDSYTTVSCILNDHRLDGSKVVITVAGMEVVFESNHFHWNHSEVCHTLFYYRSAK